MNQWKTAAFVLSILWISSTFIIFEYHHSRINQVANESFQEGFEAGNASGYTIGWKNGFDDGNRSGYRVGFRQGNETGYSLGWRNSWKYSEFSGHIQKPDRLVTFTGNFTLGGYHFIFRKDLGSDGNYSTIGYTWTHNDTVFLETGWSAKSMEGTCDHELAHNFFPQFDHPPGEKKFDDPIYNYSDDMDIEVCDRVIAKALEY